MNEYVFIRFRPLSCIFHYKHINYAQICKIDYESYNDLCNNHKIKQTSNIQFSINRNFALNYATSIDLTNKRAIGQKAFKRYVELHEICKHLSGSV